MVLVQSAQAVMQPQRSSEDASQSSLCDPCPKLGSCKLLAYSKTLGSRLLGIFAIIRQCCRLTTSQVRSSGFERPSDASKGVQRRESYETHREQNHWQESPLKFAAVKARKTIMKLVNTIPVAPVGEDEALLPRKASPSCRGLVVRAAAISLALGFVA